MNNFDGKTIHYRLLKLLSENPDLTQRQMAKEMGVSLSKLNYCVSELTEGHDKGRTSQERQEHQILCLSPHAKGHSGKGQAGPPFPEDPDRRIRGDKEADPGAFRRTRTAWRG